MTELELISQRVLNAIEDGELELLPALLRARGRLLETNAITEESLAAYELGEKASLALNSLKQQLVAEHARFDQLRRGFAETEPVTHFHLQG